RSSSGPGAAATRFRLISSTGSARCSRRRTGLRSTEPRPSKTVSGRTSRRPASNRQAKEDRHDEGNPAGPSAAAVAHRGRGAGVRPPRLQDQAVHLQRRKHVLAARGRGVPELPGQASRGSSDLSPVPRSPLPMRGTTRRTAPRGAVLRCATRPGSTPASRRRTRPPSVDGRPRVRCGASTAWAVEIRAVLLTAYHTAVWKAVGGGGNRDGRARHDPRRLGASGRRDLPHGGTRGPSGSQRLARRDRDRHPGGGGVDGRGEVALRDDGAGPGAGAHAEPRGAGGPGAPLAGLPRRGHGHAPGRRRLSEGARAHGAGPAGHGADVRTRRHDGPRGPQVGVPMGDRRVRRRGQAGGAAAVCDDHAGVGRHVGSGLQPVRRLPAGHPPGDAEGGARDRLRAPSRPPRAQASGDPGAREPGGGDGRRLRGGHLPARHGGGVLSTRGGEGVSADAPGRGDGVNTERPEPLRDLDWPPERARAFTGKVADLYGDLLARPVPEDPMPEDELIEYLRELAFRWSGYLGHPRFYAYISGAGTVPGAAADLLAAGINMNVGGWHLSPSASEVERHLTEWFASV